MKSIEDRQDISLLVDTFYGKVRSDALLGPIFNGHITDEKWPEHLTTLTDFWETNLFGVAKFKGSPTQKHLQVDRNLNYTVEQRHFGRWLELWFETIDQLFTGELAEKAKNAARNMATGQYMAIWYQRPENMNEDAEQ